MVLRRRLGKGRELFISALTVRPDRSRAGTEMRRIHVVLRAGVLANFIAWFAQQPGALVVNWFGVKLRIGHDHLYVKMPNVGTRPAFDDMLLVAMRICILISPCTFFFEGDRIDDKCIAFP